MSISSTFKNNIALMLFTTTLISLIVWLWLSPAGEASPKVTFNTLDQQQINLQQLQGKPVIISFWATSCPGCVKEIPDLINLYQQYQTQGIEIIGIAMDYDPESQVRAMVQQKHINYPIVLDSDASLAKAFGDISLTPTTLFISSEGLITQRHIGITSKQDMENFLIHNLKG